MPWSEIAVGVLVGALIGVAATFFSLYKRITDIHSELKQSLSDLERRFTVLEQRAPMIQGDAISIDQSKADPSNCGSARIIFTSKLDDSNDPIDDLETFDLMSDSKFWIYVNHFGLTSGSVYSRVTRIAGPDGKLINESKHTFLASSDTHYTWGSYTPKIGIDKPGIWHVTVLVNNSEVAKRDVTVIPGRKT